jgi:predicted MFS family arabinose efflux permease
MNRDFFLLWQSQFISQIGTQGTNIAVLFWVKHVTDSASLLGLIMIASSLPLIVLGPIAGTLADRYSRRSIIIVCDILDGIAILSLAALIFIAPNSTKIILPSLFVALVLVSVIASFFKPAIFAAIPDLVPKDKITPALSLYQGSTQLSIFIGQGISGVLFGLLGAPLLFLIDGLSYFYAAMTKSLVHIPQNIPTKGRDWRESFSQFKRDTMVGFRYVWNNRGMRSLFFAFASLNFFLWPIILLLPFYVENFLKASTDWYGFLVAGFWAGATAGTILAGVLKLSGRARGNSVVGLLLLFSMLSGALGFISIPIVALITVSIAGVTVGLININIAAVLQQGTASEIRGRVFGLLGTLSTALMPVGMGIAGVVADLTGQNIPLLYITCGVIITLLSLRMLLNKDFRALLASEAPPQ